MKALTLRHISGDLARAIERRARDSGSSLSAAVVALLEQATGLARRGRKTHHELDRFAGTWSAEDAQAFDAALSSQRGIDRELWP